MRGINLDAVTGALLPGDLSGYIADYNAQWQAAAAGLRRLFAQPRRSSAVEGSSYGDSSSSSSTDGDDSSSPSSGYDTGAQNAWGSGDMRAYDRILGGTPTDDDCSRYGC